MENGTIDRIAAFAGIYHCCICYGVRGIRIKRFNPRHLFLALVPLWWRPITIITTTTTITITIITNIIRPLSPNRTLPPLHRRTPARPPARAQAGGQADCPRPKTRARARAPTEGGLLRDHDHMILILIRINALVLFSLFIILLFIYYYCCFICCYIRPQHSPVGWPGARRRKSRKSLENTTLVIAFALGTMNRYCHVTLRANAI